MADAQWYVAHTYSGYENKVKANIEKAIENRKLHDQILEVSVPVQDVVENRNGVKRRIQRKIFPGYVLIHMIMNDDTWYVVRNTRGVTGFVGPGSKPVPLSEQELAAMFHVGEVLNVDFVEGETATVISGPFMNTEGKIVSVNPTKETVTLLVDSMGRDTELELGFSEVKVISE